MNKAIVYEPTCHYDMYYEAMPICCLFYNSIADW